MSRSPEKSMHRKRNFTGRLAAALALCVVFCNLFLTVRIVRGDNGAIQATVAFLNGREREDTELLASGSEPEPSGTDPGKVPESSSKVPETTKASVPKTDPKEYEVDISQFEFNSSVYPDVRVYIGYMDYKDDIQLITKVPVKTIADHSDTSGWYSFGKKENGATDKGYDRLAAGMPVSDFVDLALEMAGEEMGEKLDASKVDVETLGYESHNDHLYRTISWNSLMQARYSYPSEGYEDRYDYETPVEPIFAVVDNYQPGHAPRMLFGMTGPDDTETVGKYMVNNVGYVYLYLPVPEMRLVDSSGEDTSDIDIGVRSARTLKVRFDTPTTQLEGRLARRVRYEVTDWPEEGSRQDISVGYSTEENKLKILGTKEGDYTVKLYLDKNEDVEVSLNVHVLEYVPDEEDDFQGYNSDGEDLDIITHTVAQSEEETETDAPTASQEGGDPQAEATSAASVSESMAVTGENGSGGGGNGAVSEGNQETRAEASGEDKVDPENLTAESGEGNADRKEETASTQAVQETTAETVRKTEAESVTAETVLQEQQAVSPYQHIVIDGNLKEEQQEQPEEQKQKNYSGRNVENNKLYLYVVQGSSAGLILIGIFLKLLSFRKQI